MVLKIHNENYKAIRSYYPEAGKPDFDFPVLLHGTKIAFRSAGWPNVWYVGYIKIHPTLLTTHWVSTVNHIFINDSPEYYEHLWLMNVIEQFGTLLELHILQQDKEIVL